MYTWEIPFRKVIHAVRSSELLDVQKSCICNGILCSNGLYIERAALFLTLVYFVLLGNRLQSDIVFSVTQYFNLLKFALAVQFPLAMSSCSEILVTLQRVTDFLVMDERKTSSIDKSSAKNIQVVGVFADWNLTTPALQNINLNIQSGGLYVIVGRLGSGKTSLLQVMNHHFAL